MTQLESLALFKFKITKIVQCASKALNNQYLMCIGPPHKNKNPTPTPF